MLLPLSDAPNPRGVPIVNYLLIAANIAVYLFVTVPLGFERPDVRDPAFAAYIDVVRETLPPNVPLRSVVANMTAYDVYVFQHGYKPGAPQITDLLYSLFLHGGFMHLFGNMLFLWIYGDNVESRLGRLGYLFWYLATGIAATLFFAVFSPGSMTPLVGASGAISGVLGFYFLWFPRNVVRLFVFLFPIFMNVVTVPARIVLGIFLLVDNVLPFIFSSSDGGVAHGAHIGGFFAGLAVAWVLDRKQTAARPAEFHAATTEPAPLSEAVEAGSLAEAARAYFALPAEQTRRALTPDASLALGRWLAANKHPEAALIVFRRHLRDYPTGPTAAAAHLGLGLIQFEVQGQVASAYQHFLDALDLNPDPETAERARVALGQIAALQKYQIGRKSHPE